VGGKRKNGRKEEIQTCSDERITKTMVYVYTRYEGPKQKKILSGAAQKGSEVRRNYNTRNGGGCGSGTKAGTKGEVCSDVNSVLRRNRGKR